jgi:hypothetical protein
MLSLMAAMRLMMDGIPNRIAVSVCGTISYAFSHNLAGKTTLRSLPFKKFCHRLELKAVAWGR